MKIFIYILYTIAILLMVYNISVLDFSNLFGKESTIAWIGILACLSVIVLLTILTLSKKIAKNLKDKK